MKFLIYCHVIFVAKIVGGAPSNSTTISNNLTTTTATTIRNPATGNIPDPCLMEMDPGPCYGKFVRFYFDITVKA